MPKYLCYADVQDANGAIEKNVRYESEAASEEEAIKDVEGRPVITIGKTGTTATPKIAVKRCEEIYGIDNNLSGKATIK